MSNPILHSHSTHPTKGRASQAGKNDVRTGLIQCPEPRVGQICTSWDWEMSTLKYHSLLQQVLVKSTKQLLAETSRCQALWSWYEYYHKCPQGYKSVRSNENLCTINDQWNVSRGWLSEYFTCLTALGARKWRKCGVLTRYLDQANSPIKQLSCQLHSLTVQWRNSPRRATAGCGAERHRDSGFLRASSSRAHPPE